MATAVNDLRGWLDYDRDKLPSLSPEQRVDYFEKRVSLVVIRPLQRILKTEIIVHGQETSALLIFGVSLCCAIEATGKFRNGSRGRNQDRFYAFLDRYMTKQFNLGDVAGMTRKQSLWSHFRNGLAHGFAVCHGGFEGGPREKYFKVRTICGYESLEVNPTRLLNDYVRGFEKYLIDLRRAPRTSQLRIDFDVVFQKVFVDGK